jgi:hypothetical protein
MLIPCFQIFSDGLSELWSTVKDGLVDLWKTISRINKIPAMFWVDLELRPELFRVWFYILEVLIRRHQTKEVNRLLDHQAETV